MTATMTRIVFIALLAIVAVGCKQANDDRVPAFPVRMEFNQQVWGIYGVHTYGEHRIFDRSRGLPSGYYNYDPDALTGLGGVLLVSGYNFETGDYNMPLAYDLACPVEADRNKGLLSFDEETLENCDEVVVLSAEYYPGCMYLRNRYMVDNADVVIAHFNGAKGGTMYTLSYAKKNKKSIIII